MACFAASLRPPHFGPLMNAVNPLIALSRPALLDFFFLDFLNALIAFSRPTLLDFRFFFLFREDE